MSTLATLFGWATTSNKKQELPSLFPLSIAQTDFISIDVSNIYSKILTDVIERTEGISDELAPSLWDNCLQSENSEGLVTMLARSMVDKKDLFLVFDKSVNLLRKATNDESTRIRADYTAHGSSEIGTFVSFRNYKKTDMIKLYSMLEYCAIASLNKNMNLSKAVQIKMSDLRGSVASIDSADVEAQALELAKALAAGKDVLVDVKDAIETATPELTATEKSMFFINERRSFYLGLPSSYVTGEAPAGLGDSGEGDAKAIERGLKSYYFSIVKPVIESVWGIKTSFRSDDFRMISTSLQVLQAFELVSDEYISADNKLRLINKLFGFPSNTKGGSPGPAGKDENEL